MPGSPVKWLDCQPFLARVCDGMALGELLHGENFSLYDSMTAIEIGDVKMDIGLRRDAGVPTAEELVASGAAPLDLPPTALLALMDRLLAMEATWHSGAMLPQTVYSSLYMLQPAERSAGGRRQRPTSGPARSGPLGVQHRRALTTRCPSHHAAGWRATPRCAPFAWASAPAAPP